MWFLPTTRRLRSTILAGVLAGLSALSVAHAAITQVLVRMPPGSSQRIAEITFDAPVCIATQEAGTLRPFQAPPTALAQTRLDGQVLSIVVDTLVQGPCLTSTVLAVNLPILPEGQYTLRVAQAKFVLTPIIYANNTVQSTASTSFAVGSIYAGPSTTPVYLQQGPQGTELSTFDAGSYQYRPTYASDTGSWQPIFHAWQISPFEAVSGELPLQRVFVLRFRGPGDAERFFYTIDTRERDALVASQTFTSVAAELGASPFWAVTATGGVCSAGLVAIFRAFEPTLVLHRYVPVATYRTLIINGWKGDGIAFCVAPEPVGVSSWAPN